VRWVLVVLLAVVMVAVGCSGDDDDAATPTTTASATTAAPSVTEAATTTSVQEMEVSTTTVPSAEVVEGAFTFADDDLCEWVSEDEVAEFVAAEFEWDGTAVLEGASEPEEDPDSCQWRLMSTAGEAGGVTAGNASTWEDFNNEPYDFSEVEVVDFNEDLGFVEIGSSAVSGYPSLSDGVVVHSGGFGQYAFWVPPSDEYLYLMVVIEDGDEGEFFGVADRFVRELGWLG